MIPEAQDKQTISIEGERSGLMQIHLGSQTNTEGNFSVVESSTMPRHNNLSGWRMADPENIVNT